MTRLAIDGGEPVRDTLLPYGRQTVTEEDREAVARVLCSDWLTTGPAVREFEEAIASEVEAKHAVALSSGTAALHAAMAAAGIGPGDEVVTTPITFCATANAVLYVGGTPVFADVERDTLNLSPACAEQVITPRTRAILAVDFAGQPAELEDLRELCRVHDLLLVEDGAHALGATYQGSPVGSIADMTTFSFHPVKNLTSGEGGVVTTDDAEKAEDLRSFRNHGIETEHRQREALGTWYYEVKRLGFNYRLTDIQAALGTSQLSRLEERTVRRTQIAALYDQALEHLPEVERPTVRDGRASAWHLYVVRLQLDRLSVGRAEVFSALRAENIGVNVHYIPVTWHPLYRNLEYKRGQWPVAEAEYERMLTLPLWPGMSDDDLADVVAALEKVIGAYRR